MAGRNHKEAFTQYVIPIEDSLRCVTPQRFALPSSVRLSNLEVNQNYAAALNAFVPVPLRGPNSLFLKVGQSFRIVRLADDRNSYDVQTISYVYVIAASEGRELFTFHWTPEETRPGMVTTPHMHVGAALLGQQQFIRPGALHKAHIPTGPLSLAAIVELGVTPLRSNWQAVLDRAEAAFTP